MLKGKAEIILKNADGSEQRVVEQNMFTNALENIIKGCGTYLAANPNCGQTQLLNQITPVYEHLLGGVLLFENPIPEDVNTIYPPVGNKNVGYANNKANSVANNKLLGSYNTAESGEIENGYRHVWDFNTAQANGTISCICLTSRHGGGCGWDSGDTPTNGSFIAQINCMADTNVSGSPAINRISLPTNTINLIYDMSETDTEYLIKGALVEIAKTTLREIRIPKLIGVKGKYPELSPVTIAEITNPVTSGFACGAVGVNPTEHKMAFSGNSNNIFKAVIYDLETYEATVYDFGNLAELGLVYNAAMNKTLVKGNYIYALKSNTVYKLNLETLEIEATITLPNNCVHLIDMDNRILATQYVEAKGYVYIIVDDAIVGNVSVSTADISIANFVTGLAPVNFASVNVYSSQTYIYQNIITPYLATINNLATPIIKDNTQTLKIVYEITEV